MRSHSGTTTSWGGRGRAGGGPRRSTTLLPGDDGLYTADPPPYPDAHIVSEVSDFSALEELEIGHTTSPLGSGGMRSKVVAADMATAAGISTGIPNGLRPEAVTAAVRGER